MLDSLLPFGPKAGESIQGCGFLTVWEGAVRSAKTIASVEAFLLDVLRSRDDRHLMIGKSQDAILNNCVDSEFGIIALSGGLALIRRDAKNTSYIHLPGKRIDMFGGENISSFRAFRGRSYGSVYIDEANLQHPNTIAEAFNRTIAAKDRRHYMTLNPDVPSHWLYTDYLDKFRDENLPGYRWYHFTLDDNPAISDERKAELKAQYTGLFYKRFILGLRVRGEGGCYPSFINNKPGEPGNVLDAVPEKIYRTTFGLDFGGNKSATTFCCVGWFVKDRLPAIVILDEVYDAENKSVEAVMRAWAAFVAKCRARWAPDRAFGDSAEQLIIKSLNQLPTGLRVENAMKREVNDRIRLYDVLFSQGRGFIMRNCRKTIEAFENALYDEKSQDEKRLDDGTTNIDSLDCAEYAVERDMSQLIEGVSV